MRAIGAAVIAIAVASVVGACGGPSHFFAHDLVCAHLRASGFDIETRPRGLDYTQLVPRGYRQEGPTPFLIRIYEEDPEYRSSESDDALALPTDADVAPGGHVAERYWNVVLFAGTDTPRLARLDAALETLDEATASGRRC